MVGRGTAVLLCGPMRAGKTTFASYLCEEYDFKRYALADKLKQLHTAMTGSMEKDREWLQNIGASLRVVFGADFWAERLVEQIDHDKPRNIVIDDVRYENELNFLLDYCGKHYNTVRVYYVKVPMDLAIARGAEVQRLNHESEAMATHMGNSVLSFDNGEFVDGFDECIQVVDGALPIPEFYEAIDALDFHRFSKHMVYYEVIDEYADENVDLLERIGEWGGIY